MAFQVSADFLAGKSTGYEPQRQSNWGFQATIPGGSTGAEFISLAVEGASLPKLGLQPLELHYFNEVRYVAGKAVYEPVPLRLKDFVDVGVAAACVAWQQKTYDPNTGQIFFASKYKTEGALLLYGPDGVASRRWTLVGCWLMDFDPGALDMTSNEKVVMECTLRYDKALPEFAASGPAGGQDYSGTTFA